MTGGFEEYIDLIVQAPIVAILLLFILLSYRLNIQTLKLPTDFMREVVKVLKKDKP